MTGLSASILPNRWGTHSGWLEACRDAGTRVVAPSCGFYAQQWREVVTYTHDEQQGLDAASLGAALSQALTLPLPPVDGARRRARRAQRMASIHARIYAGLARPARHRTWPGAA